jgi:putative transposase
LGYHMQTNNKDGFLSLDFGLREFGVRKATERLNIYRRFVHGKGFSEAQEIQGDEPFETGAIEKFKYRSRYFTDSGIIGTKDFVTRHYQTFKHIFSSKHEKRPKTIQGMEGIYSLKRLSQAL